MPDKCAHPLDGAVAQLGERVVRNDEVRSSILLSSTSGIINPHFSAPNALHEAGLGLPAGGICCARTPSKAALLRAHLAISDKTVVNWTYGGSCPRIVCVLFGSCPIRLTLPNQFFLCVVRGRFGGGDRRRYMDFRIEMKKPPAEAKTCQFARISLQTLDGSARTMPP